MLPFPWTTISRVASGVESEVDAAGLQAAIAAATPSIQHRRSFISLSTRPPADLAPGPWRAGGASRRMDGGAWVMFGSGGLSRAARCCVRGGRVAVTRTRAAAPVLRRAVVAEAGRAKRRAAMRARQERPPPPRDDHRGRRRFLAATLARPTIFQTARFRDRYERPARENLAREIAALTSPASP